jgi:IS605 OrfB family transposase
MDRSIRTPASGCRAVTDFEALARGSHGSLDPVEEAIFRALARLPLAFVKEKAYHDGMKLTLQTQLLPERDHAARLKATVERFNEAADWLAGKAFETKVSNKFVLQKLHYADLRDRFGLSAQMAVRCIAQVCEAYKRDKSKRPRFQKHAAMPFDQRMMSFKGPDRVSLLMLDGRIVVPVVMGKYQAERFTNAKGQADLVLRKDGKWFLLVTVDLPEGAPTPTTDFIGVDLGIVNIATDSDGGIHTGESVEKTRRRQHKNRRQFQKRKSKGAKKRLKKLAGREARFRRHENHVIAKGIVATAKGTGRGLALEDLKGIRDRTEKRLRKRQRTRHSGWAFHQLRSFVEYKAQIAGVPVVLVDPRNSSRTCSVCGHCEKGNRKTRDSFLCLHCGYSAMADLNSARVLRDRARAVRNAAS